MSVPIIKPAFLLGSRYILFLDPSSLPVSLTELLRPLIFEVIIRICVSPVVIMLLICVCERERPQQCVVSLLHWILVIMASHFFSQTYKLLNTGLNLPI